MTTNVQILKEGDIALAALKQRQKIDKEWEMVLLFSV